MAAIHIPRRHLTQPQGRIELDWCNPICSQIALCVVHGGSRSQPIFGPLPTADRLGGYAVCREGVGSLFASEGHEFGIGPASTEWTLLSLAALGTAKSALLSQSNWPNQSQTYLLGNTGAGYGPEAGSFCFGSGSDAGGGSLLKATSAIDADPRAYLGLHRADGAEEIWWDGASKGSRSKTVTLNQTDARIRIEGIYTYNGWYSGSNLHLMDVVWARGVTQDEARAITAAPWQLFRADPVRFYSLPSGPITLISLTMGTFTSSGARATLDIAR